MDSLAQDGVAPAEIDAAIERGAAYLLERQDVDGTWRYGSGGPRPGCNALVVYALLQSGVSREHHAVQRALANLEAVPPGRTYDVSCLLLALTAHGAARHREWIERLGNELLTWQDGAWGYPEGQDLSNTQYAALALRAAAAAGLEVPKRAWLDLARTTLDYERERGGFGYHAGFESGATGSMTAAGVGVLAICEELLASDDSAGIESLTTRVARAKQRGVEWLGERFSVTANPGGFGWIGYYLYGLERVGGLTGLRELGGHDWYREGADFLVRNQDEDGDWSGALSSGIEDVCFALLFLSRATAPVTGRGSTRVRPQARASDLEGAPVALSVSGDTPLTLWISGWDAEAVRALEWPGELGRGPRVERVLYFADGSEIAAAEGDPWRPAGDARFERQHRFEAPGTYSIHARVLARTAPATDSTGRVWPSSIRPLDSAPLAVEVVETVAPWMLEAARDPARNLLVGSGVSASASSLWSSRHPASDAVDNVQSTAWIAAADDPLPTLRLVLARPVRADRVLVGHARTLPLRRGAFARALHVVVRVNGKEEFRLAMSPDEARKSTLLLPGVRAIRELELSVPFRAPGDGGVQQLGIAEVELQLPKDEAGPEWR